MKNNDNEIKCPFSNIPFGAGNRFCIAKNFSIAVIKQSIK